MMHILQEYFNKVSTGEILYITEIVYKHSTIIWLRISYVDAGGNFHNVGFTDGGIVNLENEEELCA